MNKTKIVCTIGPNVLTSDALLRLARAGMSIARLNGSHANLDWHENAIKIIQETLPHIPILLDLPGKKVRTLDNQAEREFILGQTLIFSGIEREDGALRIIVSDREFERRVSVGDIFFADDGSLSFKVEKIIESDVFATALIPGKLKNKKGINTPESKIRSNGIPAKDLLLIELAKSNLVDFVGLSFIDTSEEVYHYREYIGGRTHKVVAKIESRDGLKNLLEIAKASDAILIDRGDLSVETQLFDLALKQKYIISAASRFGKPVIVATEMLHTMTDNSVPTKS